MVLMMIRYTFIRRILFCLQRRFGESNSLRIYCGKVLKVHFDYPRCFTAGAPGCAVGELDDWMPVCHNGSTLCACFCLEMYFRTFFFSVNE